MSKKVLVIEDELHLRRLIQLILEKNDIKVDLAQDGLEGLTKLQAADKPDLILLDIIMPTMDGLEVLRKIKQDSVLKKIPIVMLTAVAQEGIVAEGIKQGAKDYIRKPFHPQEFVSRLQKILLA